MRGKSRVSVLKRQREVAKRERAERKRVRRSQRREASDVAPETQEDLESYGWQGGHDPENDGQDSG